METTLRALLGAAAVIGALASSPPLVAQPARPMLFEGDMVRGRPQPGQPAPVCVLSNQFKRGDVVVWRIRVLDGATGKPLTGQELKSVQVELPDGQRFAAQYGPHPKGKPTDEFWSAAWEVPKAYPTGTFSYTVTATDTGGRSATWQPFKVAPSQLTIVP